MICSSMTLRVSWRTWLSLLALGRIVLPGPAPVPAGKLLADGGAGLVEVIDDLKELRGSAAGTDFVSVRVVLLLSSAGGGLAAKGICSLAASVKGVRGGFDAKNAGAVAAVFGAGRVYTGPC